MRHLFHPRFLYMFLWGLGFLGPCPAFADENEVLYMNVLGGISLLIGLFFFFKGFSDLRKKRLIEDTPRSTLRSMAPGEVEVTGQALDWQALTGPFSQKPCVYYEYSVEEERTRTVGTGKDEHTETYWATIKSEDTSEKPFYLDDGTGLGLVQPKNAEMVLLGAYELTPGIFTDIPPHVSAFLKTRGVDCYGLFGFERPLRFTERILAVGQPLYILGTCQTLETPPGAPEGAVKDLGLAKGTHGALFMVSAKSREKLESSLGWAAFALVFFGILFIGGAVYLLVLTQQVH